MEIAISLIFSEGPWRRGLDLDHTLSVQNININIFMETMCVPWVSENFMLPVLYKRGIHLGSSGIQKVKHLAE